jgi:hypothetical protein
MSENNIVHSAAEKKLLAAHKKVLNINSMLIMDMK